MKNWLKYGNRVGIFLAYAFIICFFWYWIHPVEQMLHQQIFKLYFFGFRGMDFISFIFSIIQSYIWGYIFVALWYFSKWGKRA